ncbi:hypothetical protein EC968_000795 [Mortierella alpina]|nr:hypothetical protein EC968_000795 [Mortierella alpina]
MDISYVKYLSHELEVFDRAEAAGLQDFMDKHPALDVGPRDEVCLIFFFIFALREIAQELLRLGRHVEMLEQQQVEELQRRGQSKPKKRLWWPKVMGNFRHWIAWGSYSQALASEGYAGMVMTSVKNLGKNQPGLVSEEMSRIQAKASKEIRLAAEKLAADRLEAENAARPEPAGTSLRSLSRRATALWDDSRSHRLHSLTASIWRRQPKQDLERGIDENSPQPVETSTAPPAKQNEVMPAQGLQAHENAHGNAQQSIHPLSTGPQGDENVPDLCSTSVAFEENQQARMLPDTRDSDVDGGKMQAKEAKPQAEGTGLSPRDRMVQIRQTSPPIVKSSTHLQQGMDRLNDPGECSLAPAAPIAHAGYGKEIGGAGQSLDDRKLKMSRDSHVPLLFIPAHEDPSADDDRKGDISQGKVDGEEGNKQSRKAFETTSAFCGQEISDMLTDAEEKKQQPPPPQLPKTIFVNVSKPKTWRYRFWEYLQVFESDEVRYGFKMALALTFVGLWGWLDITGMLRAADRGQWTMTTIMAVLSPTIGATFSVCGFRIGGTLVGTLWGLITYLIYPDNPFVVSAMLSIMESEHSLMGVIMLLSFSTVSLTKYHRRTNETIYEICYKQVVNITLGIIISVILNTFLWPVLARRELRKEIAQLISRQGVLFAEMMNRFMLQDPEQTVEYERYGLQPRQEPSRRVDEKAMYDSRTGLDEKVMVSTEAKVAATMDENHGFPGGTSGAGVGTMRLLYDSELEPEDALSNSSRSTTSESRQCQDDMASLCRRSALNADRIAFQHVEHQLQTRLLKITQLLELSRSEPRLKEDFPEKLYKQIVQCCQNILDRIISMRMAAQLLPPKVRNTVIGPMNYYRRDLVGAMLLYFSVISSSLASKTALPPFLPSARLARLRVVNSVRNAILAHQAQTGEDHYSYIYIFAFSTALEEVIEELELLAILIKPIVGITLLTSYRGYGVPSNDQGYLTQPSVPPSIQVKE